MNLRVFNREDPVFRQAAHWHSLFEDGDPTEVQRIDFNRWLTQNQLHQAAYEAVQDAWSGLGNASVDARILSMRRAALDVPGKRKATWGRRTAIAASIVIAVAISAGIAMRYAPLDSRSESSSFATQVGERANLTLPDGSTVILNTQSRLRVAFDSQVRRVQLLSGQAWFEVAKNQSRPFLVEAGNRIVTAHGTAFDILLGAQDQVQVTLVEGRVSVDTVKTAGREHASLEHEDLLPGDQLIVAATASTLKRKADVSKATSWREGQIIFDDDTLSAAVAEVNRYSPKKIVLGDPRLQSLRMSGVFVAGHSDSFVETVTGHFPIKVTTTPDGQFLLMPVN